MTRVCNWRHSDLSISLKTVWTTFSLHGGFEREPLYLNIDWEIERTSLKGSPKVLFPQWDSRQEDVKRKGIGGADTGARLSQVAQLWLKGERERIKYFSKMFSLWRVSAPDSHGYRQWWWERRRGQPDHPKQSGFSLRFSLNHTDRLSQSLLVAAIVLVVVEEMYLRKQHIGSVMFWHLIPLLHTVSSLWSVQTQHWDLKWSINHLAWPHQSNWPCPQCNSAL